MRGSDPAGWRRLHIGDDANFPGHCYSIPANQQPTAERAASNIHSNR
jgi:hypothetical protein